MGNTTIRRCCFLTLSLVLMIGQGQAQVLKKLTEKLERSAQTEMTKGTSEKSDPSSEMGGFDLSGMMGQTKNFTAPAQYSFDFQVSVEMKMEKGKSMTQVWKYNTVDSYFGMEMSGMLIIYDLDSDVMVTLNPKDKSYTAISTSMMSLFGSADEGEKVSRAIVKTSDTKTILGYNANKYLMEDESMKGEFWIAPEVPFDQTAFAKSLSSYSKNKVVVPDQMQGFMMEMISYDKKGKITSQMQVLELGRVDEVIDMSQYRNGLAF